MSYLLIEDTEIINSGYSILLDYLLNFSDFRSFDHRPIYWRSPGYEVDHLGKPYFSANPTYLSQPVRSSTNSFSQFINTLSFDLNSYNLYGCDISILPDIIPLSLANSFTFLGLHVGLSVISHYIRNFPSISRDKTISKRQFEPAYLNLCTQLLYMDSLYREFPIHHLFLSESVYFSSVFLEQSLSHSSSVPFLYAVDSPLLVKETAPHTNPLSSFSPRCYARHLKAESAPPSSYSFLDIQKRLTNHSHSYFSPSSSKSKLIDSHIKSYFKISDYLISSYHDIVNLSSNFLNYQSLYVVIYLHGVTDGSYFLGDSGYPLISDYFTSVCNSLLKLSVSDIPGITFLIKPHPNLVIDNPSNYPSIDAKNSYELQASLFQLDSILSFLKNSDRPNTSFHLLSSSTPLKDLFSLPNTIHLTHHGTVAHDLYSLNLPFIASSVIPRVDLFDVSNLSFIFRKNSSHKHFASFVKNHFLNTTPVCYSSENHGRTFNYIQYNNSTFKRVMCALNSFFKLTLFHAF